MSNLKTELKALWRITKFFSELLLIIGLAWALIVMAWGVMG